MSNRISRGTSHGMYRWYSKIPRCKVCRNIKCTRYPQRDLRICAGCFKAINDITINKAWRNAVGSGYNERIKYMKKNYKVNNDEGHI